MLDAPSEDGASLDHAARSGGMPVNRLLSRPPRGRDDRGTNSGVRRRRILGSDSE